MVLHARHRNEEGRDAEDGASRGGTKWRQSPPMDRTGNKRNERNRVEGRTDPREITCHEEIAPQIARGFGPVRRTENGKRHERKPSAAERRAKDGCSRQQSAER